MGQEAENVKPVWFLLKTKKNEHSVYEKSTGVLFLYVLTPIIDFKDSAKLSLVPVIDFNYKFASGYIVNNQ
jgi:hypothetical protein